MDTYNISTDINGDRGYFKEDWDEWMNRAYISRFDEDHFESRLNKLRTVAWDTEEEVDV
jgi:hypothetical protein